MKFCKNLIKKKSSSRLFFLKKSKKVWDHKNEIVIRDKKDLKILQKYILLKNKKYVIVIVNKDRDKLATVMESTINYIKEIKLENANVVISGKSEIVNLYVGKELRHARFCR